MKKCLTIIFCFCILGFLEAQDRFDIIEEKLNQLAKEYPGVNEKVDLSLNAATIQEYIKTIGAVNNINVNVDPSLDIKLSNNFSKVTAKEVFIFLCKRYDLDILFVGPIITFTKYAPPPEPVIEKKINRKQLDITYEKTADLLTYDLSNDTLGNVTKLITKLSGKNIIYAPELANKMVSGYMQSAPFNSALEKLAFANDMKVSKTHDDFYVFEKKVQVINPQNNSDQVVNNPFGNLTQPKTPASDDKASKIKISNGLISMDVQNMPISDIVNQVSKQLGKDYFLFNDLKGNATLKVNEAPYEEFLKLLFNGTELTFKNEGGAYLFGDRNLEGLRQSKLITLKNRTIEKVLDFIPGELKKGIEVKVFEDLNGIIVSGSQPRINELEAFIRHIDLVVPMVHIEVIIANVQKGNTLATGISAGLGTKPATTTGSLIPEYNVTLNSQSINNLISGINGFGVINLGNVTPNFYLNLKAMESDNVLKLRSTPQIATLNGHEAKLSIGQTAYYLEVNNSLVNTTAQQQNLLQAQNWKAVNADLSISIDPQVSGDEQITMTINVKQSTFTARVAPTAPPGTTNRDFQSLVRVKNGEMVMLGGLSENESNMTGKGLPLISRVPILKWIFGERTKAKRDDKLTIFIKPTVIYN
ncbi:MAG: type II and III secretion system protein [Bacteroidia bacterium]|nr:type II and III secretion system protein [Bacteroidia bacterium]